MRRSCPVPVPVPVPAPTLLVKSGNDRGPGTVLCPHREPDHEIPLTTVAVDIQTRRVLSAGLFGVWFAIKFLSMGRATAGWLRIWSPHSPFAVPSKAERAVA